MMRRLVALGIACLTAGSVALAAAPLVRPSAPPTVDYRIAQDGPSFMAVDPFGRTWSVWSYTRGLEIDVAVSMAVGRTWEAPALLGTPGADDLDPRIAFLEDGSPIVIWWRRGATPAENRVMWSIGSPKGWSTPVVAIDAPSSKPSLFVSGQTLTIAYEDTDGAVRTASTPPASSTLSKPVEKNPPGPDADGGTNGPDPMPTIVVKPPTKPA